MSNSLKIQIGIHGPNVLWANRFEPHMVSPFHQPKVQMTVSLS